MIVYPNLLKIGDNTTCKKHPHILNQNFFSKKVVTLNFSGSTCGPGVVVGDSCSITYSNKHYSEKKLI